jgi:hypothetical protein
MEKRMKKIAYNLITFITLCLAVQGYAMDVSSTPQASPQEQAEIAKTLAQIVAIKKRKYKRPKTEYPIKKYKTLLLSCGPYVCRSTSGQGTFIKNLKKGGFTPKDIVYEYIPAEYKKCCIQDCAHVVMLTAERRQWLGHLKAYHPEEYTKATGKKLLLNQEKRNPKRHL